jgi:Transposase DDE domain
VAPTATSVDSQSIKTPGGAGKRGYDAGNRIPGRKRHAAADSLGWIRTIRATPVAVQDRDAARPLIQALPSRCGRLQISWTDAGPLGALMVLLRGNRTLIRELAAT